MNLIHAVSIRKLSYSAFLLFFISVGCVAEIDSKIYADFTKQYDTFGALYQKEDYEKAIEYGEKSLNLSLELWGDASKNTAAVADDYASALRQAGKWDQAETVLMQAFNIYKNIHQESPEKLIPIAIEFATLSEKKKNASNLYLSSARNTAKSVYDEHSLDYANVLKQIGTINLKNNLDDSAALEKAIEIMTNINPQNKTSLAQALTTLGNGKYRANKYSEAIDIFNRTLTLTEDLKQEDNTSKRLALVGLALTYNALGEKIKTREYLQMAGRITPIEAEYLPVKKAPTKYPGKARRYNIVGFVVVQFDVNEFGETENHKIKKSTSNYFHSTSIQAAKKFLYIPQYTDGEFIRVKKQTNKFSFKLTGRKKT